MIEILTDFVVKVLGWAMPATLRQLYPKEKILKLIKVRVAAEGAGIEFWAGELPRAKVFVTLTNLSPFPLELDRAFGKFFYGSALTDFSYLKVEEIPPASEKQISIETDLTKEHIAVIQACRAANQNPTVEFNAHLHCSIHDLDLTRVLQTSHYRLVNFVEK
jgi:hypothetical protein